MKKIKFPAIKIQERNQKNAPKSIQKGIIKAKPEIIEEKKSQNKGKERGSIIIHRRNDKEEITIEKDKICKNETILQMSGNNSEKLNEIDKCLGKTGPIRNKNLHHSPQKKQKDVKDHSIKNRLCPDVFTGNCYQTIREKMVLTYIVLHHGE